MSHDLSDVERPDGPVSAVATVLHPHPGMGGDRHHPLVVALALRLAAEGVAALRLDVPDPAFAPAVEQLEAAAGALADGCDVQRVALVGYSWGAVVSSMAAPAGLVARVLVAPPAPMLVRDPIDAIPTLLLVPAHDQFGPPDDVRAAVAAWPAAIVEVVEGCDHFLTGAIGRITDRATAWLTDQLA